MKKRLLLLYPSTALDLEKLLLTRQLIRKDGRFLGSSLPTIAALTPQSEFEIRIQDEALEPVDFDQRYDLVGMSVYYNHLQSAKRLARMFRERGSTVVLGGSGVSVQPERWRDSADVLIIGEAERIWGRFIADYLGGRFEPEYRETERFELGDSPLPDYSAMDPATVRRYVSGIVQTSRGCPHRCEFCSVPAYLGQRPRFKPTGLVIREIDQLHRMGFHHVFLADDSFASNRAKAKETLSAIRDWNRAHGYGTVFSTQLAIDIADDDELLSLAVEAGLCRVLIGIESTRKATLEETRKFFCAGRDYDRDIRKINGYGLVILGSSIIGFDTDDLTTFREQFDFFMRQGIHLIQAWPLQALDGSDLKTRAIAEGRYVDLEDASAHPAQATTMLATQTFEPRNMSIAQLQQGICWLLWNLYEPANMATRLRRLLQDFEESPHRGRITMPPFFATAEGVGIALRFLRYLIFEASSNDRRDIWQLVKTVRGFSHPHRYQMAVSSFLFSKNMHHILRREMAHVARFEYPT
ncbi:MAG: radical SAM protein [Candidatus Riflebacteria bacterium]|nr:radical SAM protein [Candidatus Riflebacteria bacterium]